MKLNISIDRSLNNIKKIKNINNERIIKTYLYSYITYSYSCGTTIVIIWICLEPTLIGGKLLYSIERNNHYKLPHVHN